MAGPEISKIAIRRGGHLTVLWKSKKALACRVNRPVSLAGIQLTSTSGKDFMPSLLCSYDRTMNLGAFSGSSARHQWSIRRESKVA